MPGLTRRRFLASACLLAGAPAALRAAERLGPGQHPLGLGDQRDGLIVVPRGLPSDTPAPLAVFFHGAGGTAQSVFYAFEMAEAHGVIILAPDSRDQRTWDLVLGSYGDDADFLSAALARTLERCHVDRQRMVLAGHSDGASFALSFGIGTGDVFPQILAFSPGVLSPVAVAGKPRIFISHGVNDRVMPIDVTSRRFVPRLAGLGYEVEYREYEGGHTVPTDVVQRGFEWAFPRPAR